jgi:hypothetical protein
MMLMALVTAEQLKEFAVWANATGLDQVFSVSGVLTSTDPHFYYVGDLKYQKQKFYTPSPFSGGPARIEPGDLYGVLIQDAGALLPAHVPKADLPSAIVHLFFELPKIGFRAQFNGGPHAGMLLITHELTVDPNPIVTSPGHSIGLKFSQDGVSYEFQINKQWHKTPDFGKEVHI